MSDLSIYIDPVKKVDELRSKSGTGSIGQMMQLFTGKDEELKGMQLALLGVNEGRQCLENEGCGTGAATIREQVYQLYHASENLKIIDLGDIRPGHSLEDTHFALEMTVAYLLERNIIPMVIGGPDHCGLAMYKAYCRLERMTNILHVDPVFDLGDVDQDLDSSNHVSKLILHKPGFLFDYTNLAFQSYLVNAEMSKVMKKMLFNTVRLGEVNKNVISTEPMVRNADMFTVDMRCIRQSDSPGHAFPLPNGLYGEQLCQLAAFAGTNDRLTSIGFFEFNPSYDDRGQSAQLIAQAIWCFIDGYSKRHKEDVNLDSSQFTRYRINTKEDHELVFYKNNVTERWWLEVPYPPSDRNRFKRAHILPCSYEDYLAANDHELPEIWLQTYQKLF